MKTKQLVLSLVIAASCIAPLTASEVSRTDPVPNVPGPPADGGIGYFWSVKMNAKDRAEVDGTVGAWSWDEDSFPDTAKGWTHTSNWVALELTEDCRLSIRLERKAGVPTTTNANNPDGVGLLNLFPAFTIYEGWQETGADSHNFNNRGNIVWAADVEYLTHVENTGNTVAVLTVRLKAGKYSVVLGGNSPSTLAEGRQGYGATFSTKSWHEPAGITMQGTRHFTSRANFALKGRIKNSASLDSIEVKQGGRKFRAKVRGNSWMAMIRNLKEGRNAVTVTAISRDGTASGPMRAVIERSPVLPVKPSSFAGGRGLSY